MKKLSDDEIFLDLIIQLWGNRGKIWILD